MLEDVFAFAGHQKNTCGLGSKLKLRWNCNADVFSRSGPAETFRDAENVRIVVVWFVLHYRSSMEQQEMISKQILGKTTTELRNVDRIVFMEDVNTQSRWTVDVGSQKVINIVIWIFVEFQQRDGRN